MNKAKKRFAWILTTLVAISLLAGIIALRFRKKDLVLLNYTVISTNEPDGSPIQLGVVVLQNPGVRKISGPMTGAFAFRRTFDVQILQWQDDKWEAMKLRMLALNQPNMWITTTTPITNKFKAQLWASPRIRAGGAAKY